MPRLIFTFETLFKVLAADKALRGKINCRTTPTPPGLSSDICGISLEILDQGQQQAALELLEPQPKPAGIHLVPD